MRSATLNGAPLDVSGYREDDGIALPELAAENELRVSALGRYMNTGEGLHRFVDPVDGQRLPLLAVRDRRLQAPVRLLRPARPQGALHAHRHRARGLEGDLQRGGRAGRERALHRFATTELLSTYLVALIAGPYASWHDTYSDDGGDIPLGLYCRASLAQHMDAERLFPETKQGFDFFHKSFGVRYPFGKYDQLFVPEFNAGAMENAGAVTFLEDYVFRSRVTRPVYERRAETVLHEMAHMWFGDLVTMRWWDDLWLNESFATFASVLCQAEATEYTEAWTTFANVEKCWAYRQDQLPSTHPVAADIPDLQAVEVNFDGITYAKGASVLKQLVAYVGLEPFLAGLRSYFTAHAWGNATFADLLGALEEASGRDLSDWGEQWLRTTGHQHAAAVLRHRRRGPVHPLRGGAGRGPAGRRRAAHAPDRRRHLRRRARRQAGAHPPGRGRRHGRAHPGARSCSGVSRGKLVLVNDDDLTYCALRLDPGSLVTLIDRIGDIAEPLPRTLCWSAAWEMTREAELKARDFTALVAGGLGAESEVGVLQRLLLQAQTAVASYADPRVGRRAGLAAAGRRAALPARHRAARLGRPAGRGQRAGRVPAAAVGADELPGLAAGRRRCRPGWSSTPTCGGGCCRRWSRTARPPRPRSTPRRSATRPPPGSGRPSGPAR